MFAATSGQISAPRPDSTAPLQTSIVRWLLTSESSRASSEAHCLHRPCTQCFNNPADGRTAHRTLARLYGGPVHKMQRGQQTRRHVFERPAVRRRRPRQTASLNTTEKSCALQLTRLLIHCRPTAPCSHDQPTTTMYVRSFESTATLRLPATGAWALVLSSNLCPAVPDWRGVPRGKASRRQPPNRRWASNTQTSSQQGLSIYSNERLSLHTRVDSSTGA